MKNYYSSLCFIGIMILGAVILIIISITGGKKK